MKRVTIRQQKGKEKKRNLSLIDMERAFDRKQYTVFRSTPQLSDLDRQRDEVKTDHYFASTETKKCDQFSDRAVLVIDQKKCFSNVF